MTSTPLSATAPLPLGNVSKRMSKSVLCVLYADISGSTRLYEDHGDDLARSTIAECIAVIVEVMEKFRGRLVKTIGDEAMCVFESPSDAVLAAGEMQVAVRSAGEAGRFPTGPLSIKIGIHNGPGVEQEHEVFGEAAIIAQQVIKQAKADQILLSSETLEVLPPELKVTNRLLDTIESEGREGMLRIVEVIWEVKDLTQVLDTTSLDPIPTQTRLQLHYQGETYELDEGNSRLSLGRTEDNDLVVATPLASRRHAEIEYRRGRFVLRDMSSNGTVLIGRDGEVSHMRGESVQLHGKGQICLGGPPEANPEGILHFDCE